MHGVRRTATGQVTHLAQAAIGVVMTVALSASVAAVAVPRPGAAEAEAVPMVTASVPVQPRVEDEALSRAGFREPLADVEVAPASEPAPAPAAEPPAPPAPPAPAPAPTTATLYTTVTVNVRSQASADAALVSQLKAGTAVTAVGAAADGWQQISLSGAPAYVSAQYLSATAPKPATTATAAKTTTTAKPSSTSTTASSTTTATASGSGYGACAAGSAIEAGLTARADNVYRAVCSTFPSITSYGGRRGDGEHSDGRAIDVMVSGSTGRAVAEWARANAAALGIQTVIFEQKIWTRARAAEGWRPMSDRGSATANHYDHVHIQVL